MQSQYYVDHQGRPISKEEYDRLVAQQQQGQQPGFGQMAAALGGKVGGMAAANKIASAFGGGASAAPAAPTAGAALQAASGLPAAAQGAAQAPLTGLTAGNQALVSTAGNTPASGLFSSASPFLAPAAVAGIGAYTANTGLNALKAGAEQGKSLSGGLKAGIREAGPLNYVPILGQAAWLGGIAGAAFGSGKDKDQRSRDVGREQLSSLKLRDDDRGYYTLSDGTVVDISQVNNGDPSYNLDLSQFEDENFGEDIGTLNALIGAAGSGTGKLTSDLVGEHVNIFKGKGGSRAAVQDVKSKLEAAGYGMEDVAQAARIMHQKGLIDENERDARIAAVAKLYNHNQPRRGGSKPARQSSGDITNKTAREVLSQKPTGQIDNSISSEQLERMRNAPKESKPSVDEMRQTVQKNRLRRGG